MPAPLLSPLADARSSQRLKETIVATLGTALLFHLFIVLLGAPLLDKWVDTALLALHLALLGATPIAYALGVPSIHDDGIAARYRLTRIVCQWAPESAAERALSFGLAGTVVGAWVGAIPLALDWDRPWQVGLLAQDHADPPVVPPHAHDRLHCRLHRRQLRLMGHLGLRLAQLRRQQVRLGDDAKAQGCGYCRAQEAQGQGTVGRQSYRTQLHRLDTHHPLPRPHPQTLPLHTHPTHHATNACNESCRMF